MILMLGFCLISSAIVIRSIQIQIIGDERLAGLAKRQFQKKAVLRPKRGSILDREGQPIATSIESFSLAANPRKVTDPKKLALKLSKTLGLPTDKLLPKLREKRDFTWIKRHLSLDDLNQLKRTGLIQANGSMSAYGTWIVSEDQRVYPQGELAATIVGDVNIDSVGIEGLELLHNQKLSGTVVPLRSNRDALGRPTFIDAEASQSQDGENIQLTIDSSLQFSAEEALRSHIQRTGAKSGSVIAMDSNTGEILAMANYPSFNPMNPSKNPGNRRNRAVTDGYEPGSTFKAVLLAAALSNGWKLEDRIHGEHGSILIQGRRISEAESHEKHEWLNLKEMIQVSSNVISAKLALKLGSDLFSKTIFDLGFGTKTGIEFPGEISGRIPNKKTWKPINLATIGFGQGLLVTPLQMVRSYAAFSNGGFLVQPTLIKGTPSPKKRVLSESVAQAVTQALIEVTRERGTGIKAQLEGYRVAGKTGTAQKVDPSTKKYSRSKYFTSFIGYAMGIQPQVVIYASIDEPKGSYYASETAAPLFRDVLQATVSRFSLPADPSIRPIEQILASAKKKLPIEKSLRTQQAQPIPVPAHNTVPLALELEEPSSQQETLSLPNLKGLTVREALRTLQGHGLEVEIQGSGLVHSQSPQAGERLVSGHKIRLLLSEP